MTPRHPRCLTIETDLIATAAGEALPDTARRVREHVESCRPCGRELERYRAIEGVVDRWRATQTAEDRGGPARERLMERLSALERRMAVYGVFSSPLGPILIARTPDGVSLIEYLEGDTGLGGSRLRRLADGAVEDRAAVEVFHRELLEYLDGRRNHLQWPIDLGLARSDFHREVLRAASAVPYGSVCSYAGLACELGRPTASRAVAQALRHNPLPIVVPCHRIVGSSGALTGYAGDKVDLKRRLLAVEGVPTENGARVPRQAMYLAKPGDQWYCLPTCAWIPTAEHPHRFIFFGSRSRAEAAGFAPCGDCRPDLHPLAS